VTRLRRGQRVELAEALERALKLLDRFWGEGICMGPDRDDDPAEILSDISDILELDDWTEVPATVRDIILGKANRG
jgi:hypothetical protein